MTRSGLMLAAVLATASPAVAQDGGATEVWSLEGFSTPENATYDSERDVIYVSNVAGDVGEKDGQGFISRVSPEGELLDAKWVTGFNAPKGAAIQGGILYVADIDRLVAVDIETGEISDEWQAEGAFFNGVAVDAAGRILVADTLGHRIYALDEDALSVWMEDEGLHHPNGIAFDEGRLLVAPWGQDIQPDLSTKVPGEVLTVGAESKEITAFDASDARGNLDGIISDGNGGWLVTDFAEGALYRIKEGEGTEKLEVLPHGSADLGFDAERNLAIIPIMVEDRLIAFRLN